MDNLLGKIAVLMPTTGETPRGGFKVVLQYARMLASEGYVVDVYYPSFIHCKEHPIKQCLRKCKSFVQHVRSRIRGYSASCWMDLPHLVNEKLVFSLESTKIRGYDRYIATAALTAKYLKCIDDADSKKFYFIQGYEPWMMSETELWDSYKLPVRKIVISNWLHDLLAKECVESDIVYNGFDPENFRLTVPIEKKESHVVSMLYHEMPEKNVQLGFAALRIVKGVIPDLEVLLFGVFDCPKILPEWYEYYKNPSKEIHNELNNRAAIYVGTSNQEGWGLTIGEAMMCGQAVVCTDNDGYLEMAVPEENALVSPVGDSEKLALNIIRLMTDDKKRLEIAMRGYESIKSFSVENSYKRLKEVLDL